MEKLFADTARKAPAFQLYVDDFLAGTMSMTAEEVGVYIRLLCIQWSRGMVTQRDVRAAGGSESTNSYVLGAKFAVVEGGYQNERLEKVRHLSDIRKQAASKGGSKTQANRAAKPQANSQANMQQAVSKSGACEETPENQQSTAEIANNQIPREIANIQANGKAKPVAKPQANGQAKLNPPTPTPTPSKDNEIPKGISSPEQSSEPPGDSGYVFALQAGTWHLPAKGLAEYVATYRFDVGQELRKAAQWLRDNKDRRPRTGTGIKKFLTRWLNRVDGNSKTAEVVYKPPSERNRDPKQVFEFERSKLVKRARSENWDDDRLRAAIERIRPKEAADAL